MLEKANLLILDEPTNHLDLDSKEVLENALVDYPGTILFVSHDRYFINRIATKVLELSRYGSKEYLGDYDYYLEKKLEQEELAAMAIAESAKKGKQAEVADRNSYQQDKESKKLERQRKRRLEEIETRIEELENQLQEYEQLLCEPEIFQNHEKVLEINSNTEKARAELDQFMEEWAELAE